MIIGFGAKNIKACNVEKPLDIKPITIFMGENSSGKSSFLQAMSLLSMNKILGNDIKRVKYDNPFHQLGKVDEFKSRDNHVYLHFKFKDKKRIYIIYLFCIIMI
ncbi:MAG: AAA family ATPase [Sulfurovum sp.]|nr:AAA family ATPase [Sulfurovum sp.]